MAQKKRSKSYRPRTGDNIKLKMQPWKIKAVFDPLLAIIEQLEREGTKDVAPDGTAIFKDHVDGCWYDSHVALIGVCEAYEIHELRSGMPLNMEPLRRLANKLKYDMPVFESDTQDVRACFDRMRAATLEMTAGYARELVRDTQIQEKLQEVA